MCLFCLLPPVSIVRPLFVEESEASPAESAPFFPPRHDHGQQTRVPARAPHALTHTAELPSGGAQGVRGREPSPEPERRDEAEESTYIRSKIKVSIRRRWA